MYIEYKNNLTVLGNKTVLINNIKLEKIKSGILNKEYNLSIIFHNASSAKSMNKKYRNKNYIPNILTFPLDEYNGEIYICLSEARRQHKDFGLSYREYIILLIIHGMLHINGYTHKNEQDEEIMTEQEHKLLTKYK
ncbi:MAG: rRNA maturation RNase YbeY [Cyanobium sp. MAG06]|nr:rRNA maturation RNase YbeY [Cyanobium sp. MAG06]